MALSLGKYVHGFSVLYGCCDRFGHLLPSALLRRAQQAAMEQLDGAGLGSDALARSGLAFMLTGQRLRIFRDLRGGQRVRAVTEPFRNGFVYPRTTVFLDEQGERLAELEALWVLTGIHARHILRRVPQQLAQFFPVLPAAPALPRLPVLEKAESTRVFCAPYSMIDANGHMNNAAYADLVADLLEEELSAGKRIALLDIRYHSELRPGEELLLRRAASPAGVLTDGMCGNRRCFACQVGLE